MSEEILDTCKEGTCAENECEKGYSCCDYQCGSLCFKMEGEDKPDDTVPGDTVPDDTVPGDTVPDKDIVVPDKGEWGFFCFGNYNPYPGSSRIWDNL